MATSQSHYSALFQYRSRDDREPLEDFLTVALTEILNALTPESMKTVIQKEFLGEDGCTKWSRLCDIRELTGLKWTSHRTLPNKLDSNGAGQCDILLEDSHGPIMIIEVKIDARFTSIRHTASPETVYSDANAKEHQLKRYGQWLSTECKGIEREWRGALTLLTHFTDPPEDFDSTESKTYGVGFTNTCRWSQIFRWLKQLAQGDTGDSAATKFLAQELAKFLEENNMNANTIERDDLEAIKNFICKGSAKNFVESFQKLRDWLRRDLNTLVGRNTRRSSAENYFECSGLIHDYIQFNSTLDDWYIEWGLCWPTCDWVAQLRKEGTQIPDDVLWFVCIYREEPKKLPNEHRKLLTQFKYEKRKLPDLWRIWGLESEHDCGMFAVRAADEFGSEGNIDDVAKWMIEALRSIKGTVEKLTASTKDKPKRRRSR